MTTEEEPEAAAAPEPADAAETADPAAPAETAKTAETATAPAAGRLEPVNHVPRIAVVWVFAIVASVLIVLLAPAEVYFEWFALAIGASALLAFVMQMGAALRDGFITRTALSVAGSVLVVGVTLGVNALIAWAS